MIYAIIAAAYLAIIIFGFALGKVAARADAQTKADMTALRQRYSTKVTTKNQTTTIGEIE